MQHFFTFQRFPIRKMSHQRRFLVVVKLITFGTHFPEVDDMFLTLLVMVGQ